MATAASCVAAPGSGADAHAHSVLGEKFRCGVTGALEQRNLMVPEGCSDFCSDHWPGIQTPAQCARICVGTARCVSFDHSRLVSCGDDGKVSLMHFDDGGAAGADE